MFSFPLLYFFRDLFRESLFLRRMWPLTLSWRRSLRYRKQPPEVLVEKTFPYKVHKIHRKTHVPESLLLKSCRPRPRPATFFKKKLWHRCFPVNFLKFLRTPFLQNTSGRLFPDRDFRHEKVKHPLRGWSRNAATSKIERFVIILPIFPHLNDYKVYSETYSEPCQTFKKKNYKEKLIWKFQKKVLKKKRVLSS